MISNIIIAVLLLMVWFLGGIAYMFFTMYDSQANKNKSLEAFFMFPVNIVLSIIKRLDKKK